MGWDYSYDYIPNEEALREVDEKMVEEFLRLQVEFLGGDKSLYERVNASLKVIKVIKDIEEHISSQNRTTNGFKTEQSSQPKVSPSHVKTHPSNVPLNDIYVSALEPLSCERVPPSDPCSSQLQENSNSNRGKSINKRSSR